MANLRPSAVNFLATVVSNHCAKHGISSQQARESVATSALYFYEKGAIHADALLNLLGTEDDPERPKPNDGFGVDVGPALETRRAFSSR